MAGRSESHQNDLPPAGFGLARIGKACGYSLDGLACAWRSEPAFRQEVFCAVVLLPVAFIVSVSTVERVLLIGSVLLVLVVELLNSALEAAIDRISMDHHPLSKRCKDAGSAAVMLAIVAAVLAWIAIVGPRIVAALG